MELAVRLVRNGAKLIGANPDLTDKLGKDFAPAAGALIAPIELASGTKAFFVGKPNPIIMRHGRKLLGCERQNTAIVGDRMDTDIIAGIHSDIDIVLVLSGVTSEEDLKHFSYHPSYVLSGVGDIPG
ncbi:MAG: HAD hydrolase-like protein [Desulfobacterales bacterium]|nr:HAD hydrolase-like protein [Deltaproteobacteria bacterium]NNL77416.1 HAD hydrolase-like protein [Desulfobacterales bacterium]